MQFFSAIIAQRFGWLMLPFAMLIVAGDYIIHPRDDEQPLRVTRIEQQCLQKIRPRQHDDLALQTSYSTAEKSRCMALAQKQDVINQNKKGWTKWLSF